MTTSKLTINIKLYIIKIESLLRKEFLELFQKHKRRFCGEKKIKIRNQIKMKGGAHNAENTAATFRAYLRLSS